MSKRVWLEQAEAAALQLASCCSAARAAASDTTGSQPGRARSAASASGGSPKPAAAGTPEEECAPPGQDKLLAELELQQAARHLQQLLDELLPRKQQSSSNGTRGDRGSGRSSSSSLLLLLPPELLPAIARLAGKEARLACRQLRDAYDSPPSGTLREPLQGGCSVDSVEAAAGGPRYAAACESEVGWQGELLCEIVKACYCPPRISLGSIQHCVQRWPGAFTALELAGATAPDAAAIQCIHAALPGLRALKCGWVDFTGGAPVPQFTALTSLTVTANVKDALQPPDAAAVFHGAQTLQMAPAVRALRLDLRFLPVPEDEHHMAHALQSLQHLTHLDVTFDEAVRPGGDMAALEYAWALLERVPQQLQSLTLRSPAHQIDELRDILELHMTALTRLHLVGASDATALEPVLPRLSELPCLRALVLGCDVPDNRWAAAAGAGQASTGALMQLFEGAEPCNLASLTLPVQQERTRDTRHPRGPHVLLEQVQQQCPRLTSLQAGSFTATARTKNTFAPALSQQGQARHWLGKVGGMGSLQRLALLLDEADVGCLGCLASLGALTCLWLQLKDGWRMEAPLGIGCRSSALALGELTPLRRLTLSLDPARTGADKLVRMLLEGVGALPQLLVLETYGMVQSLGSEQPWGAFARAPPPLLERLVLRVNCGEREGLEAARQMLARVDAVLHRHLPARVQVAVHLGGAFSDKLGPRPWEADGGG